MGDSNVTINVPLYLRVLSRLPGVTKEDIREAEGVFAKAFTEVPGKLTFYRGSDVGDGIVRAKRYWHDYNYASTVRFFEDGSVREEGGQFSLKLPASMAKYFFAGIFGPDELSEQPSEREASVMDGIRLLYDCAEREGSLEGCEDCDGTFLIDPALKAFG